MESNVLNEQGNCKRCGAKPSCWHDLGSSGNDIVDDFRLICPNCGEINKFVHVDMGNDQETCPWCGQPAGQDVTCAWMVAGTSDHQPVKESWNLVHKIREIQTEEDPAGCDGEVYVADCGHRFFSWSFSAYPMTEIGSSRRAKETGLKFCDSCF